MRISLDDASALARLDGSRALETTRAYARQFAEGWNLGRRFAPPPLRHPVHEVVVLGTGGGSAASVRLLEAYLWDALPVPLFLVQGYRLPAYVDGDSLVIAVSHSGNTEEILATFQEARQRGATLVVLTAGGTLKAMAEPSGIPVCTVPGGLMPRIAIGYLFFPLLALLAHWGLVDDRSDEVEEAIALLDQLATRYAPEVPTARNAAKQIALELEGRIPLLYGSDPLTGAVALRWKNQLAENSKLLAFANVIPHLHHDEAVGWDGPSHLLRQFHVTLLRDAEDDAKTVRRQEISAELLAERVGAVRVVTSEGTSRLARLFSLVYLGDWVSLYAALRQGIDPTPVAIIDLFKAKMGQRVTTA